MAETERYPAVIPEGFDSDSCEGCKARIMWAISVDPITLRPKMRRGRTVKVPLNVRPHDDGTYLITGMGRVRTIASGELVLGKDRLQGHHATCPSAPQFKSPRRRAR
jgi:hypothetical protein